MGGRLFWLFLGGVGFVFGFDFAEPMLEGQAHSVMLIIALLAGLVGALSAVFLQKIAIVVGGFLAGGYLLIGVLTQFGIRMGHYHWLFFLIGGIIGSILMKLVFGWSLIILSSLIGAVLILQTQHFGQQTTKLLFIFLLALGIAIQCGLIGQKPPPRRM
jgi:hypothetical protein